LLVAHNRAELVISGKHRKGRAAFSITGTRSLLSCKPQERVAVTTSLKGSGGIARQKGPRLVDGTIFRRKPRSFCLIIPQESSGAFQKRKSGTCNFIYHKFHFDQGRKLSYGEYGELFTPRAPVSVKFHT